MPHLNYREPMDFGWKYNDGRERYVKIFNGLGFFDICECDIDDKDRFSKGLYKRRPDSGAVGLAECTQCGSLCWPLSAVYMCDECCEPTLSDSYPVLLSEPFLCNYCK